MASFGKRRSSGGVRGRIAAGIISIRDLARYRLRSPDKDAFDGRSVNVDEASRGLGVSKRAVRGVIANTRQALTDTAFRRLSGRAEADTSKTATPRGMLQAAFGGGPRGGPVDAAAAAQKLGVTQGTVRRWAAGTQQPSAEHLTALKATARRSTSTKRGRKAAVDGFRNSASGKAALQGGTTVWVYGYQGVPAPQGEDYSRDNRMMHHPVSAQSIEDMLRRYEEDGADGFRDWLETVGTSYMKGDEWEFTEIYDLGFGDRI